MPAKKSQEPDPTGGFRAKRNVDNVEMVLIERNALMMLTSVSKAVFRERNVDPEDNFAQHASRALEAAINLAEGALNVSDQSRSVR